MQSLYSDPQLMRTDSTQPSDASGRRIRREKLAEWGVLAAYTCMVCVAIPFHEPWVDEAQAWLLARDLSLPSLLFHFLRREGHPALWYLLLWGPAHLHAPYALLNWLCVPIAVAGIWVLLRYGPFPFYVRALLPFTLFLAYQYAVVARSYVLFPLLGFLVAHLYQQQRPMRMAVALALLANLSLHGTIVAIAFAVPYALRLRRERMRGEGISNALPAALLFVASIVFAAICIWPTLGALPRVGPTLNKLVDTVSLGASHRAAAPSPSPAPQAIPADRAGTTAVASPSQAGSTNIPGRDRLGEMLRRVLSLAVAHPLPLAVAFELFTVAYLLWRGQPLLIVPPLVLALFLVFVYSAEWHVGLLWVTLLMSLWAAWDVTERPDFNLQSVMVAALAIVCVLQLPWTWRAFAYDFSRPTSANPATAAYLKTLPPGTRIAGFGRSVGVQPYFASNIFFNQRVTFGNSGIAQTVNTPAEARAAGAQVIVTDQAQAAEVESAGYRQTHEFCGALWFPYEEPQEACLGVLELPR